MTQSVNMWRSSSANLFETEHEALRDDLRGMLIDSGHVNAASAEALAAWFCTPRTRLDEMREIIDRLANTHPDKPVAVIA